MTRSALLVCPDNLGRLVDASDGVHRVHLVGVESVLVGVAVVNTDVVAVNVCQRVLHPVFIVTIGEVFVSVSPAGFVAGFGTSTATDRRSG